MGHKPPVVERNTKETHSGEVKKLLSDSHLVVKRIKQVESSYFKRLQEINSASFV